MSFTSSPSTAVTRNRPVKMSLVDFKQELLVKTKSTLIRETLENYIQSVPNHWELRNNLQLLKYCCNCVEAEIPDNSNPDTAVDKKTLVLDALDHVFQYTDAERQHASDNVDFLHKHGAIKPPGLTKRIGAWFYGTPASTADNSSLVSRDVKREQWRHKKAIADGDAPIYDSDGDKQADFVDDPTVMGCVVRNAKTVVTGAVRGAVGTAVAGGGVLNPTSIAVGAVGGGVIGGLDSSRLLGVKHTTDKSTPAPRDQSKSAVPPRTLPPPNRTGASSAPLVAEIKQLRVELENERKAKSDSERFKELKEDMRFNTLMLNTSSGGGRGATSKDVAEKIYELLKPNQDKRKQTSVSASLMDVDQMRLALEAKDALIVELRSSNKLPPSRIITPPMEPTGPPSIPSYSWTQPSSASSTIPNIPSFSWPTSSLSVKLRDYNVDMTRSADASLKTIVRSNKITRRASVMVGHDLRPQFSFPCYEQGNLGGCTANAGCALYHYYSQSIDPSFVPSRLFQYYNERLLIDPNTATEDCGATAESICIALRDYGVCDETEWAYDETQEATIPPSQCYFEAKSNRISAYHSVKPHLHSIKTEIALSHPVLVGVFIFPSFESVDTSTTGVVSLPSADELEGGSIGGHAMLIVGFQDYDESYDDALAKKPKGCIGMAKTGSASKGHFIVRNSLGADWGDGGHCYFPYEYLLNSDLVTDFWGFSQITTEPDPTSSPDVRVTSTSKTPLGKK